MNFTENPYRKIVQVACNFIADTISVGAKEIAFFLFFPLNLKNIYFIEKPFWKTEQVASNFITSTFSVGTKEKEYSGCFLSNSITENKVSSTVNLVIF